MFQRSKYQKIENKTGQSPVPVSEATASTPLLAPKKTAHSPSAQDAAPGQLTPLNRIPQFFSKAKAAIVEKFTRTSAVDEHKESSVQSSTSLKNN